MRRWISVLTPSGGKRARATCHLEREVAGRHRSPPRFRWQRRNRQAVRPPLVGTPSLLRTLDVSLSAVGGFTPHAAPRRGAREPSARPETAADKAIHPAGPRTRGASKPS